MRNVYDVKDTIPHYLDGSIIYVIGKNAYLYMLGQNIDMTWKEIIDKAIINRKEKKGSMLIIIEQPLRGYVYQFGNYDRRNVYENGETRGYA